MGILKLVGFMATITFAIGIMCLLGIITFAMAKGFKDLLVHHDVKYPYLYTALIMVGMVIFIPCIPYILYGLLWLSIICIAALIAYAIISTIIDFITRHK